MNELFAAMIVFIPRLLGAVAIGILSIILAVIAQRATSIVLKRLSFDALTERLGLNALLREGNIQRQPSSIIGTIIYWIILILGLLAALGSLGLDFLAETLNQVFLYTPRALTAIILLTLGTAASGVIAEMVGSWLANTGVRRTTTLISLVRYGIIFITLLLAASVLQIDITILIVITIIVLSGIALTAALAVGLGLRDLSKHVAAGRYLVEGIAEGDHITVAGISGVVEEIGYAITTVRGSDDRLYLIPNAQFMEHIVEKDERGTNLP